MRAPSSSIQIKLFAVIFGLTVVLVSLMDVCFLAQQIASVRHRLENRATAYASLLSREVGAGGRLDDRASVRDLFAAVMEDRNVNAIALYEPGGQLVHVAGRFEGGGVPPHTLTHGVRLRTSDEHIRAVAPVAFRDVPGTRQSAPGATGTVVLELSLDQARHERANIVRLALLVGALAIGIGGVAAWLVGRSFARRLRLIADATRAVATGDLSPRRLGDDSSDEVGQLAASFNVMFSNITSLIGQIRESGRLENEHLDWLVHEHTKELNATVERYRTLVEKTHAIPWELEPGTLRVAYISPQVEALLGRPVSDFTGDSGVNFIHPDDRARVVEQLTALNGATEARNVDLEYRVLDANGQSVHVRSAVSTEVSSPGAPVILRGISFDVTQERKMELELRQAQKLESVGRLAAGVAHEINTPVQFVSDSVHFVRDAATDLIGLIERYEVLRGSLPGGPSLEAAAREIARYEEEIDLAYLRKNIPQALDRSLEGLGRVAVIVRSMKEFAHPEQREMAPVDLNRAIEGTLTIARNEYKYVADVETDFGPLPPVQCHGGDVNQAFLNIIVNAAHAIGDKVKGTESKGTIAVRTWQEGAYAVVAVRDTGGGIPAGIRDRIFDPFFTTKEVGKGTGQGLPIARVVVEKHGGELSVETEEGIGTTFFIRLPIEGVHPPAQAAE